MPTDRARLMLDGLQSSLPTILAGHPDVGGFWSEFASHTDVIEDAAATDCDHVRGRIQAMLAAHGLAAGMND